FPVCDLGGAAVRFAPTPLQQPVHLAPQPRPEPFSADKPTAPQRLPLLFQFPPSCSESQLQGTSFQVGFVAAALLRLEAQRPQDALSLQPGRAAPGTAHIKWVAAPRVALELLLARLQQASAE